jgi:hypothetical protein
MRTLLQKAKESKSNKSTRFIPDKEFEELALAWCRDEITLAQINKALNQSNTGYRCYAKLALTLKKYLNDNYKISIFQQ